MSNSNTLLFFLHYESTTATDDIDKANFFNSFFHSVFTVSSCNSLPDSSLCSIEISKSDIFQILVSLDTYKAKGMVCLPLF